MCTTLRHTTVFTYSHANTPLGQSERTYYLSYFINNLYILLSMLLCRTYKLHILLYMLQYIIIININIIKILVIKFNKWLGQLTCLSPKNFHFSHQ